MGMQGIRAGMMGMWEIRVGKQGVGAGMLGIGDGNKGNHGENLRIGVAMINKKCGEG